MEEILLQLASSVTIKTCEHTGPARPDLQWQRACRSSIHSGQGSAGSQTLQELPADAHGLSGGGLECVDTGDIMYWTNLDVAEQVILDWGESRRTEDVWKFLALV